MSTTLENENTRYTASAARQRPPAGSRRLTTDLFVDANGFAAARPGYPQDARAISQALEIVEPKAAALLLQAIRSALATGEISALILQASGQRRVLVSVRQAREMGYAVVTATVLKALDAALDPAQVAALFGLPAALAQTAAALAAGATVAAIAEARGATYEIIRGEVKALVRRAGVANKRELNAVLNQVAAVLAQGAPVSGKPFVVARARLQA
jgi:hypothetical protein